MTAPRRPTRLPRWHEWAVYATLGALALTGIAWLLLDQWVRVNGEFGPEHHPAEQGALIVHGIAAYVFLLIAGALVPVHVMVGWTIRRNLISGLALAGCCVLLALSALGLYYIGADAARGWTSVIHWGVGLVAVPALIVHAWRGRSGGVTPPRATARPRRGRPKPGG